MQGLSGSRAIVTGGTRGLGLGIVAALAAHGSEVTVIARDPARTADARAAGAIVRTGDARDRELIGRAIAETQPSILVLNAGAIPAMAELDEQTWESFNGVWENDVHGGFVGIQAALKAPLAAGSRVLIASSGAATIGAPLSGSYAGAKRMLWFMAQYANEISAARELGITFQVLVPMQMIGRTELVETVAGAYAKRSGMEIDAFLARRYQKPPMTAEEYGECVVEILTDPLYESGVAFGIDSVNGVAPLPTLDRPWMNAILPRS